jgi:hypothetical protein
MSGQVIQFPLRLGLAEDSNPKAQPMSALRSGANIRWPKDGQIGKRWGTIALPTTVDVDQDGVLANLRRFVTRGLELSVTDGQGLFTYDPVTQIWRGDGLGHGLPNGSEIGLEWYTLLDDYVGVATSDVAISGDMLVHAWVTGDPTLRPEDSPPASQGLGWVQVFNWRTRELVRRPVKLPVTGLGDRIYHVRVLIAGGLAFVLFSFDEQHISQLTLRLSGEFDVLGTQALITDLQSNSTLRGRFDAIFKADGDLVVVYEKHGTSLRAARFTRSLATFTSAAAVTLTDSSVKSISICEVTGSSRIYILYCQESDDGGTAVTVEHRIRYRAINSSTMASALAPVTVVAHPDAGTNYVARQVAIYPLGTTSLLCAWSGTDQTDTGVTAEVGFPSLQSTILDNTGAEAGLGTTSVRRMSAAMVLLSRIFKLGAKYYALAADARYGERTEEDNERTEQARAEDSKTPSLSSYVIELSVEPYEVDEEKIPFIAPPHRFVGKIDHDIAAPWRMGLLPQVAIVDGNTILGLTPFQGNASPISFNLRAGLRCARVTVDPDLIDDPWRSVSIGPETYIAGGRLGAWDGRTLFDYGMRQPFVLVYEATLDGEMPNGNYIYQFEPGYRSSVGVLHRGPMSVETTVHVSSGSNANGSAKIVLMPNSIDCKQTLATEFSIEGVGASYFDAYRTEAGGSALHKLTYEPRYNVVPNHPDDYLITFTDKRPDNAINGVAIDADSPEKPPIPLNTRPEPYTATSELEDVQPPGQYTVHVHGRRIGIITGNRREYWFSKDANENPGIAPGFNSAQVEVYEEDLVAATTMDEKRIMFAKPRIWFVVGDGPTVAGTDNRFQVPQVIQSDIGCTNPRSVVSMPLGVLFEHDGAIYLLDRGLTVGWIGRDVQDTLATYPKITSAVLVSSENEVRFTCNKADGSAGLILVFDYERKTWMTRAYPGGAAIVDACLLGTTYYFATASTVYAEQTADHLDSGAFVPSTVRLSPISPAGPVSWHRVRRAQLLGTSLSNHQLTILIRRDFSESTQQTRTFAAGSDTTTVGPLERAQIDLSVQKVQAVEIQISDAAPANANAYPLGNGGGFTLDGVALLVSPKSGLPRITPSRRG